MAEQCILAIECDWRIRKLIRANLETVGLTVREAVSGPHGLQLIGERRPDLILLDLDLPDMDALHLLGVFHVRFADDPVPVVAMYAEPPGRRFLHHAQVSSFLQKPFAVSALLQQVQKALDDAPVRDQTPKKLP
jgi:CheY-like chemotaxis protein